jgi:hypothetical protein
MWICDEIRIGIYQWERSCKRDRLGAIAVSGERQERAAQELEEAADGFIGALRLAQGVDEAAFARLPEAIIEAGSAWEAEDYLPKRVVNILIGMFSFVAHCGVDVVVPEYQLGDVGAASR